MLAANISGSVCLVDANFRAPSLPHVFGTTNHYGLADALRTEKPLRGFAKALERNLWLVSCGSAVEASTNLLHSEQMKRRFAELRKEFDYVLIDAPPLNTHSERLLRSNPSGTRCRRCRVTRRKCQASWRRNKSRVSCRQFPKCGNGAIASA